MLITIKDFIKESIELNPLRWIDIKPSEIVEFIDEILYSSNTINITEKIAGQHLTININRGFVTVSNKETSLDNKAGESATKSKFGKPISTAIVELSKKQTLPDVTWRFELVHPKYNHDYIKYKNTDILAIEYTGKLDKKTCNEINALCRGGKILCSEDIKAKFKQSKELLEFKQNWENGLRKKILSLDPNKGGRFYSSNMRMLKDTISNVIDKSLVSVVDNVTPVEGIVAKTSNSIFKLQTPTFLKLQRFQMTLYSILKCKYNEQQEILNNPFTKIKDLKTQTGLTFDKIYSINTELSLNDVVKYYLEKNSEINDADIDLNHYKKWMTKSISDNLLSRLQQEGPVKIFEEIKKYID